MFTTLFQFIVQLCECYIYVQLQTFQAQPVARIRWIFWLFKVFCWKFIAWKSENILKVRQKYSLLSAISKSLPGNIILPILPFFPSEMFGSLSTSHLYYVLCCLDLSCLAKLLLVFIALCQYLNPFSVNVWVISDWFSGVVNWRQQK